MLTIATNVILPAPIEYCVRFLYLHAADESISYGAVSEAKVSKAK